MKQLPGSVYRRTHQASVDAILGSDAPQVISVGDQFYNEDRWSLVCFIDLLTKHTGGMSKDEFKDLVLRCNLEKAPRRRICIASTPDELSRRMSRALIGGAYHEAWHTLYSMRENLDVDELWGVVEPRWKEGFWVGKTNALKTWSNIVEDIRIERLGRVEFPGSLSRLEALQDFVLEQETQSEAGMETIFRDLGLGYSTPTQDKAWEKRDPKLVVQTKELLGDLLEEAIHATREDKMAPLRIAMDILLRVPQSLPKSAVGERHTGIQNALKNAQEEHTGNDSMPWRPYRTDLDKILSPPTPTTTQSGEIAKDVRSGSSYLISRLRTLTKRYRQGAWSRGHKRGSVLSSQMLTDTYLNVRSGIEPKRAFDRPGRVRSPSTAISIMVDRSGSMCMCLEDAKKALLMLGTVLDSLEVKSEMVGFYTPPVGVKPEISGFHRNYPVEFIAYKTFQEPMSTVSGRILDMEPDGGTPTGDAIHYGLHSLSQRTEKNRVLFVVTDGDPRPPSQRKVVRYFLEKGTVPIFGIGVGSSATKVSTLFDQGVWVPSFNELPAALLGYMKDILLEKI